MSLATTLYLIDVLADFEVVFCIIAALCCAGLCISIAGFFSNYSDYKHYNDENNKSSYIFCRGNSAIW